MVSATVRRHLIIVLLLAACGRERPAYDVVLITLDTTRADHIGCYGGKSPTPAIDAVAASGVRFAQADAAAPLTLPSHATILSGLLPLHHGVRNNAAGVFPDSRETLATMFANRGYQTGAFVSSFVLDHRFGLSRGFETYDDAVHRGGESLLDAERPAVAAADAAMAWLARKDARPSFLWIHFYDPHAPYAAPEPFRSQFASSPYDGEIAYVDSQIARVLQKVDRSKTIVVIAGDHGEGLGDHGEMRHGLLTYESTLRVPLIVAAPSVQPHIVKTPVSTADIAPTILGLAGAELKNADGEDLSRDLIDGREPAEHDVYAETEYPVTFGWQSLAVLRRGNLKLIRGAFLELFDLSKDGGESANAAPNERRALGEMARRLDELRASATTSAIPPIDAETRAKLASLGYVAPGAPLQTGKRADPRAMREIFRQFEGVTSALETGRVDEARAIAERLVQTDPRNRVFRSTLANACRRSGDLDRAIALYRESVALSPQDAETWYDLASALQEKGAAGEARAAVDEAVRLDPRNAEAINLRGAILAAAGDTNGALETFRRALAIDPRNARAYTNTGNVLRVLGRTAEAEAVYRRAADLDPAAPDPLNGLGVLLVQIGRAAEALPYFDRALALAPRMHEARLNRAIALMMTGDRTRARSELQSLLDTPQRDAARELLRR